MRDSTFNYAAQMEVAALKAADGGALILTPTARLADRYRHAARTRNIRGAGSHRAAWEPPAAVELRSWIRSSYDLLWDPRLPAGTGARLKLMHDAAERASVEEMALPPEGFPVGPSLYNRLQEAFDACAEYRLRAEDAGESPVHTWRALVFRQYERLLKSNGFLAWHDLVGAVRDGIARGILPLPDRVVVPLAEDPPPLYGELLEAIARRTSLEIWRLETPGGMPPKCRLAATAQEECRLAAREAASEWEATAGGATLALVAFDEELVPLLARCLEELAGRALPGDGEALTSIPSPAPLTGHPLFLAATLPLSPPESDCPRALARWLRSTFAAPDRLQGVEGQVLEKLMDLEFAPSWDESVRMAARRFPALKPLSRLTEEGRRSLSTWLEDLRACWDALGFFRFDGRSEVRDSCASAEEALRSALRDLEAHCGTLAVDRAGARAWIEASVEGLRDSGRQRFGGIQVLGRAEIFGLPFDRVWALGTHGRALPPAASAGPLLSAGERIALAGGDAAARSWGEGLRALGEVLACVASPSEDSFSRALLGPDGKQPTLPCPYVEDFAGGPDGKAPYRVDLWGEDRGAWMAAPWMAGASAGLAHPRDPEHHAPQATGVPLPADLRATALDDLLQCPFRYFAKHHLHLDRSAESTGLSAAKHGTLVHRILDGFARSVASGGDAPWWPEDFAEAWTVLRRIAEDALGRLPSHPSVTAEAAVLLGDDEAGSKSLLRPWLEAEAKRAQEGWRFLPPSHDGEHPFGGLRLEVAGLTVHGKADRVDRNGVTLAVWDYKTGTPPSADEVLSDLNQGQLPAYVAALSAGLLTPGDEGRPEPHRGPVVAGYIAVRPQTGNARRFHIPVEVGDASWEEFLRRWENRLASRAAPAREGLYEADPVRPASVPRQQKTACSYCDFACLCGYFDAPETAPEEGEGEPE